MKTKTGIKAGLAAICAAASLSAAEAKADYDWRDTEETRIELSAGYQDSDLSNGMHFADGLQVNVGIDSSIGLYNNSQFRLDADVEVDDLAYYNANGETNVIDADVSAMFNSSHMGENTRFDAGVGVNVDCRSESGSYEGVPLESSVCAFGPVLYVDVLQDYVSFRFLLGAGFGEMGNNVQGYLESEKYKGSMEFGLHFWRVDAETYLNFEFNNAVEDKIFRYNAVLDVGAVARLWFLDEAALELGYRHSMALFDTDRTLTDSFTMGMVLEL